MHETRRLCGSGHQTSIVTTLLDLLLVDLLSRMFARWCQENFLCYMIHEQVLDFLCAYTVALADPERSGPPTRSARNSEATRIVAAGTDKTPEGQSQRIAGPVCEGLREVQACSATHVESGRGATH